jgi:plasmid maintenance system antidote protein VapI
MKRKGRWRKGGASGERNGHAKLTQMIADEIRTVAGSRSQGELARAYGVSQSRISAIVNGKAYVCDQTAEG